MGRFVENCVKQIVAFVLVVVWSWSFGLLQISQDLAGNQASLLHCRNCVLQQLSGSIGVCGRLHQTPYTAAQYSGHGA